MLEKQKTQESHATNFIEPVVGGHKEAALDIA
jgi:hypothetical protein